MLQAVEEDIVSATPLRMYIKYMRVTCICTCIYIYICTHTYIGDATSGGRGHSERDATADTAATVTHNTQPLLPLLLIRAPRRLPRLRHNPLQGTHFFSIFF